MAALPLASVTTKDQGCPLPPVIARALAELGFATPTPVQEGMRAAALLGADVIALAPTGTGKTLGFGVPVLARLLNEPPKSRHGARGVTFIDPYDRLRALVISPTRELAQQVAKDLEAVTKSTLLRVAVVYGKSPEAPQREAIRAGPDVLVGTPGRIREFLDDGSLSLAGIRMVVIDEADRMADMGFLPQVEAILGAVPQPRQVIGVTATLPPSVEARVVALMREPTRIEIGRRNAPASGKNFRMTIDDADKVALLLTVLKRPTSGGTAVYVRTRRRAGWVAAALERNAITVSLLHGDRSQRSRDEALAAFAQGRKAVLVATDVAARGLHVTRISRVINYDVPLMPEDFVHRVGRAGHGGGAAESLTFVDPHERLEWERVGSLVGEVIGEEPLPDISAFQRPSRRAAQKRVTSPARAPKRTSKPPSRGEEWRKKKSSRERTKPLAKGARPGGGVKSSKANRGKG